MAEHLDPQFLAALLEQHRDAAAVDLIVVEDVDLLGAQLLGPLGAQGALQVVGGDHADVVDLAGGPIDARLTRLAAARLGQAGRGVRGADHQQVRVVQDGHGDLGGAGVEGAEVHHDVGVLGGPVGIGLLGFGRPAAGRGGGVVPIQVLQREGSGLPVGFFQGQLDAVDHGIRLGLGAAGARQARDDLDRGFGGILAGRAAREQHQHRRCQDEQGRAE